MHFHVDELFASLDSLCDLVVEAPGHEDDLNQHNVEHVCPPHGRRYVKRLSIIGHNRPVEDIVLTFFLQAFESCFRNIWLLLCLLSLQISVHDEEKSGTCEHDHQEDKVLGQQRDQLS